MAIKLFSRKQNDAKPPIDPAASLVGPPDVPYVAATPESLDGDKLKRMFQQHRFGAILRQGAEREDHPEFTKIETQSTIALEKELAVVPDGVASMVTTLNEEIGAEETDIEVKPFLMAVVPVTNARFQQFVNADCYNDLGLWPEEIWPHLIDLHDSTGQAGPKYWRNGLHNTRLANHPVVGISWYEAKAYAKWVGLRLATEAEWQMAASWRIQSEADVFRRYPWGDAMDYQRCNLWGSYRRSIVAVDEYELGCAPNGVRQLVGNIWEWLDGDFELNDDQGQPIIGEMPMRPVRGGAYDTYFDTQAAACFRSGQIVLARTHNCGFRCALEI